MDATFTKVPFEPEPNAVCVHMGYYQNYGPVWDIDYTTAPNMQGYQQCGNSPYHVI